MRQKHPLELRVEKLTAERDEWRSRYENVLDKWLRIEWALWQHETLDFRVLLETEIPKPLRDAPAPRRNTRKPR
jgi:hypothetical protein